MHGTHVQRVHHVILRCPSCGAQDAVLAEAIDDEPSIVCRNCGETWPASNPLSLKSVSPAPYNSRRSIVWSDAEVIDAVRRPLVSYSGGDDSVWTARMLADAAPPARRERRWPAIVAGAAALLFIAAFLGAREKAVAAVPDLAGLYAAIGLPVNLRGLAIENVTAHRKVTPAGTTLIVRGDILNLTRIARSVPPLRVSAGPAGVQDFPPPATTIDGGASREFRYEMVLSDKSAEEVTVRFSDAVRQARTGGDEARADI